MGSIVPRDLNGVSMQFVAYSRYRRLNTCAILRISFAHVLFRSCRREIVGSKDGIAEVSESLFRVIVNGGRCVG